MKSSNEKLPCATLTDIQYSPIQTPDSAPSRARVVKNLLMVGLSFLLIFTGYRGLSSIQSSFNSVGGLGSAGLAVTNICMALFSLFVPPLAIGRLGPKRTMVASLVVYLVYMCANVYPHWGTIIPASVLMGSCGGALWTALSVYIVQLAERYAKASGLSTDLNKRRQAAMSIFFGVFFTMNSSCNVWGNLVSYLTLTSRYQSNGTVLLSNNITCGQKFCSATVLKENETRVRRPPMENFYIMMACFIAAAVLSVLVMLLLVDRTDCESDRRPVSLLQLRDNLKAMGSHMVDPRQLLLIILTINLGLSQSFALSEFTESFIACSSGIAAVGRVMMCYGAGLCLPGLALGQLAGKVGRIPVLLGAACVQITMETLALLWQVTPEPEWLFYAFAGVWGCVDIAWNSQIYALYGEYFEDKKDAAYSACNACNFVGNIIGFSYNKLLCVDRKLQFMLVAVSLGSVGLIASFFVNRQMKQQRECAPDVDSGQRELKLIAADS